MKVNRFVALAWIALLTVGAMGLISSRSLAKTPAGLNQQVQVTAAPNGPREEAQGIEEASSGPDTDAVQEQVGEQAGQQVEDGQPDGAQAPGSSSAAPLGPAAPQALGPAAPAAALSKPASSLTLVKAQTAPQAQAPQPGGTETTAADPGPDEQSPSYAGSIAVDQALSEGMSEADEAAALAGQAKISLDQAKAAALAANPGASVVKAELDNENGALVYSVELSNGSDVKVDAGNAAILHTDTGGDHQD
jgi:uncharacterized membrane protein YkoI